MICHGLNCTTEDLIEAHIVPQGFARFVRGDHENVTLTLERIGKANPQLGEYDPDILCARCDNILGVNDEYAIEICRRFEAEHIVLGHNMFELADVDCHKFCKFVLSILWRASISKRRSFARINLGPYETVAMEVLFGAKKLADIPAFEVIVQRYRSSHLDPSKFYFHPERAPFGGLNSYGFGLAGFRLLAKLDNRPLPQGFWPVVINRSNVFRGPFVVFEECSEFQSAASIVRANAGRKNSF